MSGDHHMNLLSSWDDDLPGMYDHLKQKGETWACPQCAVTFDVEPSRTGAPRYRCEQKACEVTYRTGQRREPGHDWRLEPIRMMIDAAPTEVERPDAVRHRRWFERQA